MDKRGILAVVLSLAVLFIYQLFFLKHPPAPKKMEDVQRERVVENFKNSEATVAQEGKIPQTPKALFSSQGTLRGKDIPVDTPLYTATFTTGRGGLKSFKLKQYRKTIAADSELIELVEGRNGMPPPLAVSFPDSSIDIPADIIYAANADSVKIPETMTTHPQSLVFSQSYPNEIKVEKIFTFYPDRYNIDLEVRVYNLTTAPLNQSASLSWYQFVDPQTKTDSYSHKGPVSFVSQSVERQNVEKLDTPKTLGPNISWGGFESKYFLAAMVPRNPSNASLYLSRDDRNIVSVSIRSNSNIIPPGQFDSFRYSLYLGPKDYTILKTEGAEL
ncbi:MAG: membrane protein insertase YidC, partial [Syntrophales bacterium]|nr:membrane protein insertase YidC [Syntrophales bacterium]